MSHQKRCNKTHLNTARKARTMGVTTDNQRFDIKTLFTWSGGPRSSGVGFFCFVSPRA